MAGQALGFEFQVNTYTTQDQTRPRIASDSSGVFVSVWTGWDEDGSNYGVFGQRFGSTGTALGAEFRVNTYTTKNQRLPAVASDAAGNFVVVWQSFAQVGAVYGIFGQRFGSAGAPLGPEFRVNTYTTYHKRSPAVACDSSGEFLVVWQGHTQDGFQYGIFGQRYDSAGTPLGAEFRVNAITTGNQGYPTVASRSSGGFVVVWQSYGQDGAGDGVFGRRIGSTGVPLASDFRVNTYTTSYQRYPSVASDASGAFVVVWQSYDNGSKIDVFGQRYASDGTPAGTEFAVGTYTTGDQRSPVMACDSAGNFVVTWQSGNEDGSSWGIFGRRFDSSGAPGSAFRVNSYTTNFQRYPSIASDSLGDFVVVWASYGEDGSGPGVFAQAFEQIGCVASDHTGPEVTPPVASVATQSICQ